MRLFHWKEIGVPTEKRFRIGFYVGEIVIRIGRITLVRDLSEKESARKMHFKFYNVN